MELLTFLVEIFPTVGFPVIACGLLGWFIYKIYTNMEKDKDELAKQNAENMAKVQAKCQEREDKLYNFMREQSAKQAEIQAQQNATNERFAQIIAQYEIKLDDIKADVKVIKDDITEIKAKQA